MNVSSSKQTSKPLLLFVTFGLESYLHLLIVIYDNFLCAERWIVSFRIDLCKLNFKFSDV